MADFVDNVLLVLRGIVRTEPKVELRVVASKAADELQVAIADFYRMPSRQTLQNINGLWAVGQRIIDLWNAPQPTPPRAGVGELMATSSHF